MTLIEQAEFYYWYHCVVFPDGFVTDGDYDLRPLLHKYGFPINMKGMSALDVGRASGYFSFEMERRGATVTSVDIKSILDWDHVGGETQKRKVLELIKNDVENYSRQQITGAFDLAVCALRSNVESCLMSIYELTPEAFDGRMFDVVFAGSIMSHLRDPVLALEKLKSVTRIKCIISVPAFDLPETMNIPVMSLVGDNDPDRRSWWVMNRKCLNEMLLCVGFKQVVFFSDFTLVNRKLGITTPHLVAHAYVEKGPHAFDTENPFDLPYVISKTFTQRLADWVRLLKKIRPSPACKP